MNTRTRSNLHIGEGCAAFAALISSGYKNGTVGIIFGDGAEALSKRISDALYQKGNRSKLLATSDEKIGTFGEHVRYYIGVGGADAVKRLRELRPENRFSFYPSEIMIDCFCDGSLLGNKTGFAENCYFDTTVIDITDTHTASYGICELMTALASLLDIYCWKLFLPYRDSALEALVRGIKKLLIYPPDRDYFLPSVLNLLKGGGEYLSGEAATPLLFRIRNDAGYERRLASRFFTSYLFFVLGIMFTKWDFNDMLIPASGRHFFEPSTAAVLKAQNTKISECLFTREELGRVAAVFRALGNGFDGIDAAAHLASIIEESGRVKGWTNIINNSGIIERLINYENTKEY